jgi:PAS domain S-box-containing protein
VKPSLRLLLLEDNHADAQMVARSLSSEWPNCEIRRASNKADFEASLEVGGLDAILSDYVVPGFPGSAALALARQRCPEVPFLFVSGAIGDEVAVESLKAGATDYVLKDRLARLGPAIRRALAEAHERAARAQVEQQLRQSEEQYRVLVNSVDGIVWQAELPDLRFTFVSQQAERMLGYPVRDWLEEPAFWQNHIHPEDREKAVALCQQLTTEEQHHSFEYRMLAADGAVVWLRDLVSVRRAKNRSPQLQGIMVNISARKQAEAARRDVLFKLERTNKILTRQNQEIQNFYHTLSHELKTPLTSAREFISILMDGLAGPVNQLQSEYLEIARDSCDQLRACVNDLLEATRLETGKLSLDLKTVSLGGLARRVAASLSRAVADKQVELRLETQPDLPEASLDEHKITQVLTNLLSNALRFTPPGGTIYIKVAEVKGHPELIQVSVTDTGCGIPKHEQERIFDRLHQVKAGDATSEHGIGLGLYLCRELVRLHGGTISVESEPGRGSTFTFVLPKTQQLLQTDLLLVDDDPDMLDMLRQLLVGEHYTVRVARDGREALQEMRRQTPDIVLLDLAMPELSGAATLGEIRKAWGQIPVIVHTAFANGELMKQALTSSPFTLLAKPCTPDQILQTVRKVQRSGDTDLWRKSHFGLERPRRN